MHFRHLKTIHFSHTARQNTVNMTTEPSIHIAVDVHTATVVWRRATQIVRRRMGQAAVCKATSTRTAPNALASLRAQVIYYSMLL